MAKLTWDSDPKVSLGVDRGVLYKLDGTVLPWSGLVSVMERGGTEAQQVYFDGRLVHEIVSPRRFNGVIQAYTYPDAPEELEGMTRVISGAHLGETRHRPFHLSWRTQVVRDDPDETSYRINVLFNVRAAPSDATYATATNTQAPTQFGWDITAVPEEFAGYPPSAHLVFDSASLPTDILEAVELILYGGTTADPRMPSYIDLMELLSTHYELEIVDKKDGTFIMIDLDDDNLAVNPTTRLVTVTGADTTTIDDDTFTVKSTRS